MSVLCVASQLTVNSLAYATESGIEAAQIRPDERVPFGQYLVNDDANEFSLYRLRRQLGLKAVVTFEEFLQRLIPVKFEIVNGE